jgi:adenylate cyclase
MEATSVERRLAAILAADVVGYSRLMEVDEAGTLARLKTVRLELIDPAITKCKGRIIKTSGDGMLVEFQSVTEALRCAVDFQERMARRNRDMPASRTLLYRIGINLGDVIVEGDDIFGDGVNVAARLESIAEPGGICISAAVRDQVGDRLEVGYEDLGEQQVKNINRPIRVFKVQLTGPSDTSTATPVAWTAPQASPRKPSIAVLPFINMSGDAEQEFFSDGLTEDIITELSRFRELLVISRNAVFIHKGKAVKAKEIAREFGVDYVVEGSVRKTADCAWALVIFPRTFSTSEQAEVRLKATSPSVANNGRPVASSEPDDATIAAAIVAPRASLLKAKRIDPIPWDQFVTNYFQYR